MSHSDPTEVDINGGESWFADLSVDELNAGQESPIGEDATGAGPSARPIPGPIPLPKRPVSGRYRGSSGAFQVELRVDVDRTRPMNRVSADFFQISGGTTTYSGSFIVNSPVVTASASQIVIKGLGSFTFSAGAPVVQATIPRRTILQPQAPAALQFFTTSGSPGALYRCSFESARFRTVRIETDRVSNLMGAVFDTYNTGALPSGGPGRNLSVVGAFAEAGLELIPTAGNNVIPIGEALANATWSNAELHASMQRHFSLHQDNMQWAVWQVAAQLHDLGAGLYGIMFDQQGKQRQGCAVFHQGIGGSTPERLRLQLYTYVHELGHNFNLLDSWQKSLATPPAPNRPLSLSWMNYPFNYPAPGGETTYRNQFAFQFDNQEVIHLRHAFRNNIIMGGSNFAVGSALEHDLMPDPIRDESGLSLTISTHQRKFRLGEPVVLELALKTTDARGRRAHTLVCIRTSVWSRWPFASPTATSCRTNRSSTTWFGDQVRPLSPRMWFATARTSATARMDCTSAAGQLRDPGVLRALDGSTVLSNIITMRVGYPVTSADEDVADLLMGDAQGALFYLLGSDDESLRSGNDAFDEVLAKYPHHVLADYVRLVKGVNAGRDFKTITEGENKVVDVRAAKPQESAHLLSAVANSNVLDSVSADMTLAMLAKAQKMQGNEATAAATISRIKSLKGPADMMK